MPIANVTMTIPAGQSLSNAGSIANAINLYLITPPEWSPACNLTFQFSPDGSNFYDLFVGQWSGQAGVGPSDVIEVTFAMRKRQNTISPIDVDVPKGAGGAALKLRSGTRGGPVAQAAERTFTLVVVT
jgi:hypothetical protein